MATVPTNQSHLSPIHAIKADGTVLNSVIHRMEIFHRGGTAGYAAVRETPPADSFLGQEINTKNKKCQENKKEHFGVENVHWHIRGKYNCIYPRK